MAERGGRRGKKQKRGERDRERARERERKKRKRKTGHTTEKIGLAWCFN